MASESSFSKGWKQFVDHEWIKIQSDLEINVPSAVTGQQRRAIYWISTATLTGEACVLTVGNRYHQEDPSFVLKIMRRLSRRIKEHEDALVRTAEPVALTPSLRTPLAASGWMSKSYSVKRASSTSQFKKPRECSDR